MTSLKVPADLGPWNKVTPSNEAGKANSDAAPQVVAPTAARTVSDATRADTNDLILVELRVISRLLWAGLNVSDDLDALRADEMIGFSL